MIPLGVLASATPRESGGDPHWASVVSLLHFNGTDGSTTITDERGKSWVAISNAQLDDLQPKFGATSLLLDGSGDYAQSADHADWSFGNGDFTVELFVRFSALSGTVPFAGKYSTGSNQREWVFFCDTAANTIAFNGSTDGAGSVGSGMFAWTPAAFTWYHVAASRVGNTIYLFVDGVLIGSAAFAHTLFNSTAPLTVGYANSGAFTYLNGRVDEFRITKGVGRYSASFTPPSAPFPTS